MFCKLCAATALLSFALVAAAAARDEQYSLSHGQLSLVARSCAQVMGLKRGETYFATCRTSLSVPPATASEDQAMLAAYFNCRQRRLAPGSPILSTRMLDTPKATRAPSGLVIV